MVPHDPAPPLKHSQCFQKFWLGVLWPFTSFSLSGSPLSRVEWANGGEWIFQKEHWFRSHWTWLSEGSTSLAENLLCFIQLFFGCAASSLPQGLFSSCGEWRRLFVVLNRLLIAVASPVTGHGLWGPRASGVAAPGCWNTGSIVVAHGLGCAKACGIFLDQGSNLCLLHWLPSHQGTPTSLSFKIRIPLPLL